MTVSSGEGFDPRALAARLSGLEKSGERAQTADFVLPATLREAMDAQNFLAAEERISTHAWKVAMSPAGEAVLAPLHPYLEAVSGASISWRPGMKFEAEVAVRLGQDIPVRQNGEYTREEIIDAIAECHLGAELLASSIQESGQVSFLLYLAERIGNKGYVLGPALPKSVVDTIGDTTLKVTHGGQVIYDALARHPKDDVLVWLLAYANDRLRPHTSLKKGALITTGTLCGAIELTSRGPIDIVLGNEARLSLSIV
ncbi:fumarylacetoacetate hydrolase family protein [Rhizobium sp. AN80A]|uniref:fumarylacetoacetate hydrolase family protein n=1 Tax=Rhizobium sp. AN80A TaxID=3040673 RepID=UPI0024B38602|nr:fumarylacetoacetate hydrolase family protein [Rhizobium sp. AN80A]